MRSDQKFKGAGMKQIIEFIRYRWGDEGLRRITKEVTPEAKKLSVAKILDNEWILDELGDEYMVAMDNIYGNGDTALIRECGKYIAKSNLKGVYRAFARMTSVGSLLKRASTLWRRYYDRGDVVILAHQPGHIEAEVVDYDPFKSACPGLLGWVDAVYEFYKVEGIITHPECKFRGDKRCFFLLDWK